MEPVRVRFAPSPTGFVHIGNIRNAVFDWLLAKRSGGQFILRIEDTDRARFVPEALDEIYESLRWFGAHWDEGPEVGGLYGPYFQSERLHFYHEHAQKLVEQGHAYYCFCSPERLADMRREQELRKQPSGYDRSCRSIPEEEVTRRLEAGEPYVIRFKSPTSGKTVFHDLVRGEIVFENCLLDDFVILKSDGYPTYHFASVVDDHLMEITHVIRSEEWISSTPKHILLYNSLGWAPPVFIHPPLILGPDRTKLSKRHGAVRFLDYKERGFLPETMWNFITLLGWSAGGDREIFSLDELISLFSIEGIVNHPVIFDIQKLEWMNGEYIRMCNIDRLAQLCLPYLQSSGLVSENLSHEEINYVRDVTALVQERLKVLSDVTTATSFFFQEEPPYDEKGVYKWLKRDYTADFLDKLACRIEQLVEFTVESVEGVVREVGRELGLSGGDVVHPVRMAVTGRTAGPGLFETMVVLGRQRVLHRLKRTSGFIRSWSEPQ